MKRDMEFVREILLRLEARPPGIATPLGASDFPGRDEEEVEEHLLLLHEAGLIAGSTASHARWGTKQVMWNDMRLTWEGHDFIAAATDPDVWASAKRQAGSRFATLPLEVVKALLIEVAKRAIGL